MDLPSCGPVVKKVKTGKPRLHEVRTTVQGVVWVRDFVVSASIV